MKKKRKNKVQRVADTVAVSGIVLAILSVAAALFIPGVAGSVGYKATVYLSWAMIGGGLFVGAPIFHER